MMKTRMDAAPAARPVWEAFFLAIPPMMLFDHSMEQTVRRPEIGKIQPRFIGWRADAFQEGSRHDH
ncbi:MAG: hypothetical protein HY360_24045 [Verrucomicrobia bacterium]|nr:hypothetical protein [Verrucomicrobiota bacterium]